MAYSSNINLWDSEFGNIVSERDKLQDLNISQIKLQVLANCKKDEKKTTDSEPSNNEDVINKGFLDEKFLKNSENVKIP